MKYRIVLVFLIHYITAFSQEKIDVEYIDAPVSDVLLSTENQFNVKFSYNPAIVVNQKFTFRKQNCSLEELIQQLELQTKLLFEKLNERYYAITLQKRVDLNKTQELDEVLVQEFLTTVIRPDGNGGIALSPKELGVVPGFTEPDVLESLQIIPGVQSPEESASDLFIRGGTPDQNLVLWDGIKIYQSGHLFGLISAINPNVVERVELFKSGTEAKYGNRIAGVIDMSSNNEVPMNVRGSFGFNMINFDAYIEIPISKKLALFVSGRRSFTDVIETFTFKSMSDRVFQNVKLIGENQAAIEDVTPNNENEFYFADVTAKLVYEISKKDKLTLSSLVNRNRLNNTFSIPELEQSSTDKLKIKNQGISLNWQRQWSSRFSLEFNSYFSKYNLDYFGRSRISDGFVQDFIKYNKVEDFGLSAYFKYDLNEKNRFLAGYELSSNTVNFELKLSDITGEITLQSDNGHNNMHAGFLEYKFKSKDLLINAGIRAHNFTRVDSTFIEPRLYTEVKLLPSLKLKGSAEYKQQSISQILEFDTSNLGFALENQLWTLANGENIPIQKSKQFSMGLLFSKKGWHADVEVYTKNIEGITTLSRGYNEEPDEFSEGEGKVFGIDALVSKKFQNYKTWLSYSYTKNQLRFLNEDTDIGYFPTNHDVTHYFSWSHAYSWNNFDFSLAWKYRSGTPYTKNIVDPENPGILQLDTDNFNGERLPDYHRLDISATYTFKLDKNPESRWRGKLGLSLLNVYDQSNILNRSYNERTIIVDGELQNIVQEIDRQSIGFTPNISFRVEF